MNNRYHTSPYASLEGSLAACVCYVCVVVQTKKSSEKERGGGGRTVKKPEELSKDNFKMHTKHYQIYTNNLQLHTYIHKDKVTSISDNRIIVSDVLQCTVSYLTYRVLSEKYEI